jgi:hypothetical protein
MNIFGVLSRGKSRLNEPSISAMLGYLLSPNDDHGLGDTFLRSFLEYLEAEGGKNIFLDSLATALIKADVSLEEPFDYKGKRRDIDILLSLYASNGKEIHRIIIENKINAGAANPKQLKEYYLAARQDERTSDGCGLTVVFLTPPKSPRLEQEYHALRETIEEHDNAIWIMWVEKDDAQKSVIRLIQKIIEREAKGEINPINDYMRHTLKAFIRHLKNIIDMGASSRSPRYGEDLGDIVETDDIITPNGASHKIIRRSSGQIQVIDINTGEKEIARHVMAEYIDAHKLDIPHAKLNTRQIGKRLMGFLRNKS